MTYGPPTEYVSYSATTYYGVSIYAHLKKPADEETLAGIWECKLGEVATGKYKRLDLRECTLIEGY